MPLFGHQTISINARLRLQPREPNNYIVRLRTLSVSVVRVSADAIESGLA